MNTDSTIDFALPANDHEGRARCAEMAALIKRELATLTSPDDCVYHHVTLVETLAMLGEEAPTLESVAPLMQSDGVDMSAVRARVAERQQREAADFRREMDLWAAQRDVEQARATYGEDSLQACLAISKAIQFLPPAELEKLDAAARELGLMPKAAGYTADNHPVYAVADMAAHLGLDEAEISATLEADPSLAVDASCVQRVQ